MTVNDFRRGDHVKYIPLHANGDARHKDCQTGVVTSVNEDFVFVKFYLEAPHGVACCPRLLIKV